MDEAMLNLHAIMLARSLGSCTVFRMILAASASVKTICCKTLMGGLQRVEFCRMLAGVGSVDAKGVIKCLSSSLPIWRPAAGCKNIRKPSSGWVDLTTMLPASRFVRAVAQASPLVIAYYKLGPSLRGSISLTIGLHSVLMAQLFRCRSWDGCWQAVCHSLLLGMSRPAQSMRKCMQYHASWVACTHCAEAGCQHESSHEWLFSCCLQVRMRVQLLLQARGLHGMWL